MAQSWKFPEDSEDEALLHRKKSDRVHVEQKEGNLSYPLFIN